jgi:phosphogluconate 2-dehydrogenase
LRQNADIAASRQPKHPPERDHQFHAKAGRTLLRRDDPKVSTVTEPIRLLLDSGSRRFVGDIGNLPDAARFELLSYVGKGEDGLRDLIPQAEAVYISQHALSADLIQSAPGLRFIQKYGLNCKNIDVDAATKRGIPVATVPLFRHATVAEHALALMLACARKIIPSHRAVERAAYRELGIDPMPTSQREHRPNWAQIAGISELKNASVAIMGLGDIGMEIANRCRAFGMKIFCHQRQRHRPDVEARFGASFLPFRELLECADYLVLVLPHTKETEGLIGAEQLAWMKPTATLINVARGAVVDEVALAGALASGRLAMAGLDVYREEPLPASSPLAKMPNVVLTPHTGGGSYQFREADRASGLANILDYFDGKQPSGIINPG